MTELNLTALAAGFREKVDNRSADARALESLLERTGLVRLHAAAIMGDRQISVSDVDKALQAAGIRGAEAIEAKLRNSRLTTPLASASVTSKNSSTSRCFFPGVTQRVPLPYMAEL